MKFIADLVYLLAVLVISPMVLYRVICHRRYRTGWSQRFGKIIRRNPEKKCIWLHAVSVGEVNAARTIIEELENKFTNPRSESRTSFEIVISTTTDTGFARANVLFGTNHTVIYFPLDFSIIMQRAFEKIQPTICLLMELEIWPNFVRIAKQSNIPVVVVNGRISDKSFSRYKKIKPIAKTIFQKLTLILSQTEQYAKRFIEIGCPPEKVVITGSLKYDTAQITDKVDGSDELAKQLKIENERLWIAGATGPDEEEIILDIFKDLMKQKQFADLRLIIVPRKPERFNDVAELIRQKGFDFIRYSSVKNTSTLHWEKPAVILGDTMGDLRKFYSLATVIFVGRSLVPIGGSDMAEAAALGKPTIFGPFAFNFTHTVDALVKDNGAIIAKDEQELFQAMQKCLTNSDFANRLARNGREVIRKNQGATAKSIEQIAKFLTVD